MRKRYSIVLTKAEYDLLRLHLKNSKVIFESSSYYNNDIYISFYLDDKEYKIVSDLMDKYISWISKLWLGDIY